MKRRTFIQSLAAVLSLPAGGALPLRSMTAALPAAATVPTKARFWAIYMSSLHGECTPQTLQTVLNIPKLDAKRYLSQLVSDGIIKPNPLLQKSASQLIKAKDESLLDNFKKRSEMKIQSTSDTLEINKAIDASENLDAQIEPVDDELLEEDLDEAKTDAAEAIEVAEDVQNSKEETKV